jgi:hypothetical protein
LIFKKKCKGERQKSNTEAGVETVVGKGKKRKEKENKRSGMSSSCKQTLEPHGG